MDHLSSSVSKFASKKTVERILKRAFIVRLVVIAYSITHDFLVDHIKYTDIDYHVFTNGSRALVDKRSPYEDQEYRYSPLVALIFVPNILVNPHTGKLILALADLLCGYLIHYSNIRQGTTPVKSKLYLTLWLLNPWTVVISTRGSFEPIITLLVLATIYLLVGNKFLAAGFCYGLAIHVKLYPAIYALTLYGYIAPRVPQSITEHKLYYWMKTLSPNLNRIKFFLATFATTVASSYISYIYYGHDYIEQSFLYHLRRKDLQHNFSIYFHLFRLFPDQQENLSRAAFVFQFVGVLFLSIKYLSIGTKESDKLKKLYFSLFITTYLFVSLNKVCTSQYFNWYFIFLPLILDCIQIQTSYIYLLLAIWIMPQVFWLLFAYLYEYQRFDVLDTVGLGSVLFLLANLTIMMKLCQSFTTSYQKVKCLRE